MVEVAYDRNLIYEPILYYMKFQVPAGGECEDGSFLGFSFVYSRLSRPKFQTYLPIQAARTSETSVYFNETTRRYIPEICLLYFCHVLCKLAEM
jgi:hypothetical protein